jgi:transcriptional regulator with XRE-family HTH domain
MRNMILSERLKSEREKKSWSQTELAEKLHVASPFLSGRQAKTIQALR